MALHRVPYARATVRQNYILRSKKKLAAEDWRREGNCHGNLAAEKSRAFAGEKLAPSFSDWDFETVSRTTGHRSYADGRGPSGQVQKAVGPG
jgi:hypothetical protein